MFATITKKKSFLKISDYFYIFTIFFLLFSLMYHLVHQSEFKKWGGGVCCGDLLLILYVIST